MRHERFLFHPLKESDKRADIEQYISFACPIGHVNGHPTMYYVGNPRHSQSMIAYIDEI